MTKKRQIFVVGLVFLVVGAAGTWFLGRDEADVEGTQATVLRNRTVGLTVHRDPALVQQTANQQEGRLWALEQPAGSNQEFVVDANYEHGASLKKLTGYTGQTLRESVVTNVNIQLPKQYPQYKELKQRNLTVNRFDATETVFEYVTNGVRVKQRLLLLFKNSDTAVYIRAQAPLENFEEINRRYFESIFSTATFE